MAKLNPHLTFDNFVVGPANRLASAAARRAAERPGASYNPLFIYSTSGLGKTHLLGAMARHIAKVSPGKTVEYQTAEEFLRDFVDASGLRDEGEVRQRYRDLDILLLDDVQFLTAQSDVQDLLLVTLDILIGDGKQVVLASDRPPSEIEGLAALLRTRFEGGLLVNIGPPEYETRVAILQKWADADSQTLGPDTADAIGRFPFRNVRELRRALNRVLKVQEKEDRPVGPEEATAILEEGERESLEANDSELGQFLHEISDTVAEKVQAQEAPWRKQLREWAEDLSSRGFKVDFLRRQLEGDTPPPDMDEFMEGFRERIRRLEEIGAELDNLENPWPEAAHSMLRDPERLDEAEALLASARERARPFPDIPPGPTLSDLSGDLPKLVIRAAEQLIATDRPEYNPLFVWSSDGMAARALIRAAARTRAVGGGESRVALTSIPRFAEDFIHSLKEGVAGAWRERWWSADVLLMEAAEDLSRMERAQEEFYHLYEALRRRRARVMMAADRPPGQIRGLDERLRGRLEGGLVVEVPVEAGELPGELQEALAEIDAEAPLHGEGEDKDISDVDREWIRSFQPGGPWSRKGKMDEEEEVLTGGLDAGIPEEEPSAANLWVPSPENVVWTWPRLEDRLVEDPD